MKKEKIVSYTLEEIPQITDARWEEMLVQSRGEIDTSDIPPITPEQAKHAVRGWENHPGRARNRRPHAA